jgi:hypothetical protein
MGIAVPHARPDTPDGGSTAWRCRALRAYQRCTFAADALIAGCYPQALKNSMLTIAADADDLALSHAGLA